ncbi:stage V sporulation protein E [Halobacillus halophilus]|uniref:Stage V sporulation protein E n=1 Tax=Halobacillus halophilus (strain ATCC 35676 / DSM 2266 / JCM 20832 / KCTC 3685 / LMG 17431 / NBRC 102448 / NCIMB 2269) TaxID=866895 RepID=I0JM54_HALH3|nr:stage V sporulation protein E [Halobacillus halophilus]ASF39316.1 stage V sporulation protein E [Halobacillus halophilus]CCG45224.1 stage V sporulation protein E [Halobacillus halophilus DSM 2266]
MEEKRRKPDLWLVAAILGILIMGIIMVYSSSSIWSEYKFDDPWFFAKRQILFATVGLVAMVTLSRIPYYVWHGHSKWILIMCLVFLIAVLIPGVGMVRGGARSWIGVGMFSIQPSEFMKLGLILFLARFLSERQKKMNSFQQGFLPGLALILVPFALIMLQPDLGTGVVMVGTCMVMMFTAGARISHFMWMAGAGMAGMIALIASAPYRIKRITAFLHPWEDPLGSGFQIIQSLYAIGPGGLLGLGLGNSMQKFFYLPEPQTDFIFAVLAEELGFLGGAFILILFFILLWRGIRTSLYAPDLFGSLLALGIVGMVSIQVMINVSVVTGLIPVTGITLPLVSYGGSSLTLTLASLGLLLSVSRFSSH